MSQPETICARRNLRLLMLLFLLLPGLACKTLMPSAPETSEGTRVSYPTGIETLRSADGVIVVVDHKGPYAIAFPKQWEVGAFHEDFVPTVAKHCEIYGAVCALFQALYEKDNSVRIFAIDTSPNHLTKDSMATLHIGMFQDELHLRLTLKELAAEYIADLNASGQVNVTDALEGTSNHGIPFAILLSAPITITDTSAYTAAVLVKTDHAYLEMLYTTGDETIDRVNELLPMLSTLTTDIEP